MDRQSDFPTGFVPRLGTHPASTASESHSPTTSTSPVPVTSYFPPSPSFSKPPSPFPIQNQPSNATGAAGASGIGTIPPLVPRPRRSTEQRSEPGPETPSKPALPAPSARTSDPVNTESDKTTSTTSNSKEVTPTPEPSCSPGYAPPRRRIVTRQDMLHFHASPTYQLILWFVFSLADSVRGTPVSDIHLPAGFETDIDVGVKLGSGTEGETIAGREGSADDADSATAAPASTIPSELQLAKYIRAILHRIDTLVEQNPREDNSGSRFGNPAFRKFFDALARDDEMASLHADLVDKMGLPKEAVKEVGVYLRQSFGDRERVDYGSGHELNFILWLLCLDRFGLVTKEDGGRDPAAGSGTPSSRTTASPSSRLSHHNTLILRSLVLLIFPQYLTLVRKIQLTYYLEPAGSHGVWGLDDYQFLPFLFGAAQLTGPEHSYLRPRSVHQPLLVEEGKKAGYLYFDQIDWVNATKTVKGIPWHSPMLNDISASKSWAKIESGMRKMFVNEVLGKVPIVQHLLFGTVLPPPEGVPDRYAMMESMRDDPANVARDGTDVVPHEHGRECGHDGSDATGDAHSHSHSQANQLKNKRAPQTVTGKVVLDAAGNPLPIPHHSHGEDDGSGAQGGADGEAGDGTGILATSHDCGGLSDPCGIKVPSGVAAVMEMRKKMAGELRTLPFD